MPTPLPPKPGEEPTNESELYRFHFRRLIGWYIEALDALPPEGYAWRPAAPGANSLATMMNHVASSCEWWVLGCVGGQLATLDRDRDAEFAVEVPWPEMRARLERWLRGAEALLNGMGPEDFQAISKHPAGDRMNRRCLLHVVEHMGLHLGHIELTTDWWKAAHGGTLTGDAIAAG